jgi:hypothetical protein
LSYRYSAGNPHPKYFTPASICCDIAPEVFFY